MTHPLAIVWPFDMDTGAWIGIAGMSYYGGLIGISVSAWLFARKHAISFWKLADALAFSTPLAYFFGRIGNFLNGELYGRATDASWGMYFTDTFGMVILRYPSQLLESFFEGIVLFCIVFMLWKYLADRYATVDISGFVALTYIIFYGIFRFGIEFVREPDIQTDLFFGWMTSGQLYSSLVFFITGAVFIRRLKKLSPVLYLKSIWSMRLKKYIPYFR
jgi:phosphatidylglycerol:prolipoprotein diacylglycerol transferase